MLSGLRQLTHSLRASAVFDLLSRRLTLAAAATILVANAAPATPVPVSGLVYSKALLLGPHNQPVYAEYDPPNKTSAGHPVFVDVIGERYGKFAYTTVMAGKTYNNIVRELYAFYANNQHGIAFKAVMMSAADYASQASGAGFYADVLNSDGTYTKVRAPAPRLQPGTRSVLVRDADTISDLSLLGPKRRNPF